MKHFQTVLLIAVSIFVVSGTAVAEEAFAEKKLGDQQFSIQLGGVLPLFFINSDSGLTSTNMHLGASGGLRWNAYLNNWLSIGLDVYGSMASNINEQTLFQFGVSAAGTAYWLQAYPFFFPVSLDVGLQFMRFQDSFYFGPVLKPGIAAFWSTDEGWSFGIWTKYWLVPEIYTGNGGPPASDSRLGNFLEFTLNALYHFE